MEFRFGLLQTTKMMHEGKGVVPMSYRCGGGSRRQCGDSWCQGQRMRHGAGEREEEKN